MFFRAIETSETRVPRDSLGMVTGLSPLSRVGLLESLESIGVVEKSKVYVVFYGLLRYLMPSGAIRVIGTSMASRGVRGRLGMSWCSTILFVIVLY
jgi:hypothetical protein